MTADTAALRRLLGQIDPDLRPVRAWNLAGGVSALVTAVTAARPGGPAQTLVVRQYGAANLRSDSLVASHEFALLSLLHAAGIPVPRPLYADESRTIMPVPCLVIDFIDGAAVTDPGKVSQPLADVTGQLAAALAQLHAAAFTLADAPYLADIAGIAVRRLEARPTALDESLSERPYGRRSRASGRPRRPISQCCSMATTGRATRCGGTARWSASSTGRTPCSATPWPTSVTRAWRSACSSARPRRATSLTPTVR